MAMEKLDAKSHVIWLNTKAEDIVAQYVAKMILEARDKWILNLMDDFANDCPKRD